MITKECDVDFKIYITTAFLLVFILLASDFYSFGIVTDYNSDIINIPIMQKTAYYRFILQNMMDDNEIKVEITVTNNEGIAKLLNESRYTIAPKTSDAEFLVEIKIPDNATASDSYNVSINIKQINDEKGQVVIGQSIGKTFTVNIVGEDNPNYKPLEIERRDLSKEVKPSFENKSTTTSITSSVIRDTIIYNFGIGILVVLIIVIVGYFIYKRNREWIVPT